MKIISFLSACCLFLCAWQARADQLDDLISSMRNGAAVDQGKVNAARKATAGAALKSYYDGIVNLYLYEIKLSIVDPDNNGGWPYRSFLVEGNPNVRKGLAKELKTRFTEKPDSILAYAAICPAIYMGDDKLVGQAELYLKDNDAFLYKMEQSQIDQYWRPYIKDVLEKETADKKTEK